LNIAFLLTFSLALRYLPFYHFLCYFLHLSWL
jgi:hypothetical protein